MSIEGLEAAENAYVLYCKHGNISDVAAIMGLAVSTISNWKKTFNWDIRRDKVIGAVQEKTDSAIAERTAVIIAGIDRSIDTSFDVFDEAENGSKLDMAKAISELSRTRNLLLGEATSRKEESSKSEELDVSVLYNIMSGIAPRPEVIIDSDEEDAPASIADSGSLRRLEESLENMGIILQEDGAPLDA